MNRNTVLKTAPRSRDSSADATSLLTPDSPIDGSNAESVKQAEKTLISRLVKTQRAIRRVDLFTAFCAFATLAFGVLFLGVLCDCWLLSEGLSTRGRVFFILFLLVVSLVSFLWKLAPVLRRRVNALYAAKVLEETQQDKHNLTINWLQLCREGVLRSIKSSKPALNDATTEQAEETRRAVLQNVALQAARQANNSHSDVSVDCSSLIRWGIALACLALIGAVYVVLSPKSPFASAARIVVPLANIERPQALRFESVSPGDADVFQGDFIDVEAIIPGAKASETVEILWSTEDGRVTNVAIPMESSAPTRFKTSLPEGEEGFRENLLYKVVAGRGTQFESASDTYRVTVHPQPSFRVVKTTLRFPQYTGLTPQTFDNQGDVRAVEGTTVEIVAQANEKLSKAYLLPDGDQTRAVRMDISPSQPEIATVSFTLQWKKSDEQDQKPEFTTYTLQSEDVNGEKNRDAQIYTVSILPDLPPVIRWETEGNGALQIPLNDVLRVNFSAEDPDYSLRRVLLHVAYANLNQGDQADQKSDPKPIELPLSNSQNSSLKPDAPTPFVGVQSLSYPLIPEKLGLKVGDELEYWGVAFDSRFPDANVGTSEKRIFVVVDPVDNPSNPNEEEPKEIQNEESGDAQAPGSSQRDGSSNEQKRENNNPDGKTGDGENSGNQGESDANRSETSGQEGEQSDPASSDNENSGVGETSSGAGESQEQGSEGQEEGSESTQEDGPSKGGEQAPENGQNAEQREGEAESDGTSGETSDENTKGASQTGSSRSDETGEQNPENTSGDNDPSEGDPSENKTPPNEAFQKILDFMKEQQAEAGDGSSDQESSAEKRNNGSPSGQSFERDPSDTQSAPHDSKDEVDPEFNSSDNLDDAQEKRNLPTRTSSEKPSEKSPVYQAENPDKIDPNTRRRQDDVNPQGNDYLAQNVAPDQPETSSPNQKRNDANVMLDPLDQSAGTAADSINRDSPELQGSSNVPEGGAAEVDHDAPDDPNRSSTPNQEKNQSDLPTSMGGNGVPGTGEGPSEQNDSSKTDDGIGASGNRNTSEKDKTTPSSGDSNNEGVAHGGGAAGAGYGEIESSEEQLAPADAPRLQYAEQATNLVLEYLEDNLKDKVDERLLRKLGWTEEEMRAFLEKWRKMRSAALLDDGLNRDQYLEALEKVGLDEYASLDSSEVVDSTRERDHEDGRAKTGSREGSRVKTPDRLSERVRAFNRGVSSGTGLK